MFVQRDLAWMVGFPTGGGEWLSLPLGHTAAKTVGLAVFFRKKREREGEDLISLSPFLPFSLSSWPKVLKRPPSMERQSQRLRSTFKTIQL